MGQNFTGDYNYAQIGISLSLSSDGTIVAIGEPGGSGGRTKIYQYDNGANNWNPLGANIAGDYSGDGLGISVSLSGNGTIVAIGAPDNDNNGTSSGMVKVYQYDGTNGIWNQLGSNLIGNNSFDGYGKSVSLSKDGTILAIGAPNDDDNGVNSGTTKVYQYNNATNSWNEIINFMGDGASEQNGFNVSLSSDGLSLAMASPLYGNNEGKVKVYKFNESYITRQLTSITLTPSDILYPDNSLNF
jgi:hypothetical protein